MSDKNKKIIICAGGTGGHVFPAKKLSEMLLKETVEISWIGSSRGCLLYTSPSPRDVEESRMPSSA